MKTERVGYKWKKAETGDNVGKIPTTSYLGKKVNAVSFFVC